MLYTDQIQFCNHHTTFMDAWSTMSCKYYVVPIVVILTILLSL